MEEMVKEFQIGVITTTHGIKGEVKVFPMTDDPKRFESLKDVIIRTPKGDEVFKVAGARYFKQYVILKFKDINDINLIEKYKGMPLFIKREQAVDLSEDEYFIPDLMGCRVISIHEDGSESEFGTLIDVMETGANDVYIVDTKEYGEVLLPAIKECIKEVNIEESVIKIHIMDGLLS